MSDTTKETFDHVVVGAGLSGLIAFSKLQGSKVILESTDFMGGRFSSGLHIMKSAEAARTPYLKIVEELSSMKVRWDRAWVEPAAVDWTDAAWKGAYLSTWSHYFSEGLCRVEFDAEAAAELRATESIRFFEPVVEVGLGDGDGAWVLKTPESCLTTSQVHWCAGLTAFQNAVGKHASQKFLGENTLPTQSAKDFRGGFALNWTIPESAYVGKTELAPEVASGGLFAIPVKHSGSYVLMIVHLEIGAGHLVAKTLTYVHEEILRDPKESLSLQKSLKRGLKMFFVDQAAVDMQTTSERMVVDQRLLGASRGLTWLLQPQPEIGLHFYGEESLFKADTDDSQMGLSRAAETVL